MRLIFLGIGGTPTISRKREVGYAHFLEKGLPPYAYEFFWNLQIASQTFVLNFTDISVPLDQRFKDSAILWMDKKATVQ